MGSASVSGSTTTKPAGTSTAQRRESESSERPSRYTSAGRPRAATARRARSRRRRAAAPARPRRPARGAARQRQRTEEERGRDAEREALLVAVRDRVRRPPTRCRVPTRAARHTTVATTAPTIAIVDASRRSRPAPRRSTNAGATTRSAVSVSGRGASVARRPTAHASHSSTAAATRGPSDHVASDADARRSRGHRQGDPRDAQQPQEERTRQRDSVRRPCDTGARPLGACRRADRRVRPHVVDPPSPGARSRRRDRHRQPARTTIPSPRPSSCCAAFPICPRCRSCPAATRAKGCSRSGWARCPRSTVGADGRSSSLGESDAAPECDVRRPGARRPARVPRRRRRGPSARRSGSRRRSPVRSRSASRCTPPGCRAPRAFRRAAERHARLVGRARRARRRAALPDTGLVLFLDEPVAGVVAARRRTARPRGGDRRAVGRARRRRQRHRRARVRRRRPRARARSRARGARRRGRRRPRASTPVGLARFLDGDGWIAWGAVPTDRPVGESADPHWRMLARVWCELTRRGCDPVPLRTRGVITPACGLAGYGASQAERVLGIARELAARVHDQAVAARLTLGA